MKRCRRRGRSRVFAALPLLIALAAVGPSACKREEVGPAPDCDAPNPVNCAVMKTPYMNGVWKLTAFRASGAWSPGAEKTAAGYLGREVKIDGVNVKLPNATTCRIVSAGPTTVRDGVETFGSTKGSWNRMGFEPIGDGEKVYKVVEIQFDCEGMFWGIVMQPERELYLLKVWEVFLQMQKVGD